MSRCMDYLREGGCGHQLLLLMLMANASANEDACKELLQLDREGLEGVNM